MKSFLKINTTLQELRGAETEDGTKETAVVISPSYLASGKDIMKKGNDFYAIGNPETGMWSFKEFDAYSIIDQQLYKFAEEHYKEDGFGILRDKVGRRVILRTLDNSKTGQLKIFKDWLHQLGKNHNFKSLDEDLTYLSDVVTIDQYRSKRLSYDLLDGSIENYDIMMSTLYDQKNRDMIEWSIGSILAGWKETKKNDHLVVLYGKPGSGKSTVLDIIEEIFEDYWSPINIDDIVNPSRQFSKAALKDNPLVAIQDDGSLKRIDTDDMNKIASHSMIEINEKGKGQYNIIPRAICFVATNDLVDLSDSRNGMNRRLLDVYPSGNKIKPRTKYYQIKSNIKFEIPAIAKHCLDVYHSLGSEYYSDYEPEEMQIKTNYIKNFMIDRLLELKQNDPISRGNLYRWYKEYCDEQGFKYVINSIQLGEQILAYGYYDHFYDMKRIGDKVARATFEGLRVDKLGIDIHQTSYQKNEEESNSGWIKFNCTKSLFDDIEKEDLAQYEFESQTGVYLKHKWADCKTKLKDLDTSKVHYDLVPENMIILDFDIRGEDGEKSLSRNLEEANKWPKTYAELSKSGEGIHLTYFYSGDPKLLSSVYDVNVEVKHCSKSGGPWALRRKVTKCNDIPIATISSGLPLRGEDKKMIDFEKGLKSERAIRALIQKNLNKEIHDGTKPSIDFIYKILEDAYSSGLVYNVIDLYEPILKFAMHSTNHKDYCCRMVAKMYFKSEEQKENIEAYKDPALYFFDLEVFMNVMVLCYKKEWYKKIIPLINPTATMLEELFKKKMIGFNNLRYDNYIAWLRINGGTNQALYELSQRIINAKSRNELKLNWEAKHLSYTDVFDFAAATHKQSLKKFEIEMGTHHQELGIPWDQPVPESLWQIVADYCCNDVQATEDTFHYLKEDWIARQMLAAIAGMTVNDTTNALTTKLIFEDNKNPQSEFIYTDLSTIFPGYKFENGVSTYRGEEVGEGGYVWANPGIYYKVKTFDVASMHPHSAIALQVFGPRYTKKFEELVNARIAIKHGDYETAKKLFDGKLAPYLNDENAKGVADALKTAINSVYGLTSAHFNNAFNDPRNVDNIVAKRGALFMVNLKHEVMDRGGQVVHIKTDSIKVVNPSKELEDFIISYGKQYGYDFEIESEYERICLVNDAVYIAKEKDGNWTATGTEFAVPYVFKTLFSHEPIEFKDTCETKSCATALYIDFNEGLQEGEHNYTFIGKTGLFCPMKPGTGGGELLKEKTDLQKSKTKEDGSIYAYVNGAKGFRWMESEMVSKLHKENDVDLTYYAKMVDDAKDHINEFGNFDEFISGVKPLDIHSQEPTY